jgi:hypothetical protein
VSADFIFICVFIVVVSCFFSKRVPIAKKWQNAENNRAIVVDLYQTALRYENEGQQNGAIT